MKNVLILFSMSFEPYQGRYMRAYNEAKTLVESGYKVTVLGWDRLGESDPSEVRDGIRIERIYEKSLDRSSIYSLKNFIRFCFKVLSHLKKRSFDVVHCHNLQLLPLAVLLKKLRKIPLIFDTCEPDYYTLYPRKLEGMVKFLEKFLAQRTDAILVHNDYQVRKYKRFGHGWVTLIGSYPPKEMILENFEGALFPKEKIRIGRIGSIYQENGIEEILEGFKLIAPSVENLELLFAGRVFQSYKDTFNRLIHGMGDKVKVFGAFHWEDMPKLYRQIDVSIMIYRRSAWFKNITPTKFFDSLAMGVPVIVSDMGGLKEIVEHHHCGIVVDERNPEEVAHAMRKLAEDPPMRHEMGLNGWRAVKEHYNWGKMRDKLLDIYSTVMA